MYVTVKKQLYIFTMLGKKMLHFYMKNKSRLSRPVAMGSSFKAVCCFVCHIASHLVLCRSESTEVNTYTGRTLVTTKMLQGRSPSCCHTLPQ